VPIENEYNKNASAHTRFAMFSSYVFSLFIFYWYLEAFCGRVTRIGFLFIIGVNCTFTTMNVCQWYILRPSSRKAGLLVMNAALHIWLKKSLVPTVPYETVCFLSISSIAYTISYFPLVIATTVFFPETFGRLHQGIDFLVLIIPTHADVVTNIIRFIVYTIISVGMGHACVSTMVIIHWLCTYFFVTIGNMKEISQRVR
jgi:hypothetical protein